jgi:tetrathionate reductase subunit B
MQRKATHPIEDRSRRQFVRQVVGLSAGATLLNLVNAAATQAATPLRTTAAASTASAPEAAHQPRYGMLVDTQKCATGCTHCVDACSREHGLGGSNAPLTDAQWIRKVDLRDVNTARAVSLPMFCQHCEHPPCVDVCPTGASFKRADGLVLVDKHTCIGCRYCIMACPYKARSFIHENLTEQLPRAPRGKGTVESCTLCVHRIDAADQSQPACAQACLDAGHGALLFGDLNDASSALASRLRKQPSRELRADLALNTAIRYQGV